MNSILVSQYMYTVQDLLTIYDSRVQLYVPFARSLNVVQ